MHIHAIIKLSFVKIIILTCLQFVVVEVSVTRDRAPTLAKLFGFYAIMQL